MVDSSIFVHMQLRHYLAASLIFFLQFIVWSKDGIVLCGQPGNIKNEKHFLENGLDRCKRLKKRYAQEGKGEEVIWFIFHSGSKRKGAYTDSILQDYVGRAHQDSIEVRIIQKGRRLISFLNSRAHSEESKKCSHFYYFGHATLGHLEIGYINGFFLNKLFSQTLHLSRLKTTAFTCSSVFNVVGGCRTALHPKWVFSKSVAEKCARLAGEKVLASNVRVYYPGGPVSDKTLVRKNKGQVIEIPGRNHP
jgi:hypothetical protein